MKIIVCIKQVPAKDSTLRINDTQTWIRDTDISFEINEPDAYALEAALRLKEQHGGEVVALSAGPARVQTVLREALAKGADLQVAPLSSDRKMRPSVVPAQRRPPLAASERQAAEPMVVGSRVQVVPSSVEAYRWLASEVAANRRLPAPAIARIEPPGSRTRCQEAPRSAERKSPLWAVPAKSKVPCQVSEATSTE